MRRAAGSSGEYPAGVGRGAAAAVAVGLLLVLTACGFRLQGAARLPPAFAATWLESGDRYTDFNRALSDALRAAGGGRAGSREEARAVVEVLSDDSGQRVLSVSARNTPREFEVYYTVRYRARFGVREVLPPQELTLTREYSFDETQLLAKEQERELIREALARELALLVVRQLGALTP